MKEEPCDHYFVPVYNCTRLNSYCREHKLYEPFKELVCPWEFDRDDCDYKETEYVCEGCGVKKDAVKPVEETGL